ncbi:phospholipid/cholesterol/gamma-HCH transport system substrate-binding protein [Kribbella amoyensis]|uniref:Phospholipid/cholesterol/gamma-HCH transport system substrate-binding protein n=1 Tax=Kribbella amoyensis TaxID=996641 RepID=A0A561BKY6_9ACTN|nr:MCE family protein [Kribbella amoyensis]TWD79524.1 phospholipid/cholesterol/gamma-HCH transport system substrate-binding protein [Kribbella amoyensis]
MTRRVLGVAFIGVLCFLLWLTYAFYAKVFTETVTVQLKTSHIGLQLNRHADVKLRGIIVGEVREVSTDGDEATVELALKPDQVSQIASTVSARILPKTLFGEKYVALVPPTGQAGRHIKGGDVISRDKTAVGIEIEKVLNDALPLLQAVDPADLNATLNTLATALEGRGTEIAQTLTQLDAYLKKLNPSVPKLVAALTKLTQVSQLYGDVTPDLARALRNLTVTGNTVVEKEQQLQKFFTDVSALSGTADGFLRENEDRVIRLGEVTRPILDLLERYSPEFPCFLKVLTDTAPILNDTFRGGALNINLELITNQPTPYQPNELPKYLDKRGPTCVGKNYSHPGAKPGPYTQDNPAPYITGEDGVIGDHNKNERFPLNLQLNRVAPGAGVDAGSAGGPAEQQVVDSVVGPVMGVAAGEVPDLTTLMVGPLLRGGQVNLR